MSNLKYTYALDSTKTSLVHINDAIKGEIYYCPYSECSEHLVVKNGKFKRKHFSHIKNTEKCSYDNYLHSLTEIKIIEWFNSEKEISMQILVKDYCQKYNKCMWKDSTCTTYNFHSFLLKNYYNKIEKEKYYGKYIWDLWLTNTNNPKSSPIALEIFVTHKCEENKLKSGIKTIEIKIENEEQLEKIINSNTLKEGENISFYNFHVKPQGAKTLEKKLNKFILFESMKAYSDSYNTNCKSYINRRNSSIFELTYQDSDLKYEEDLNPFSFGCVIAHKKFPNFKNCNLCKFYKYNIYEEHSICILYKQLILKDKYDSKNAITCNRFSANEKLFKKCIKQLSELSYNIWLRGDNKEGRNFIKNK